ncbi:MAG TPA: hypothetical protein VL172_08875 [Kofleriaceae bacterium]|nr:hypothetical protein [Kofleriaceae bacterium]
MAAPSARRLLALVAAALWLAGAARARADEWVIEVGAEAPGAAAAGAADVKRGQELAKQKKYADAVDVFEALERRVPAALHECYLSLAYLRAGALTRAQLVWDVARLRNSERPGWCTGDLGQQLATALRASRFVALTITVVPSDAVVHVGGVAMRGLSQIWLPAGPQRVTASAPGLTGGDTDVDVQPPAAAVTLSLTAPPAVVEPAVVQPPVEPPVEVVTPPVVVDQPVLPTVAPTRPPARHRAARWPMWVALGTGGVAMVAGGYFHVQAVDARDDADQRYRFEPEFMAADDRFGRERTRALVAYGVGTLALGVGAWWLITHLGAR